MASLLSPISFFQASSIKHPRRHCHCHRIAFISTVAYRIPSCHQVRQSVSPFNLLLPHLQHRIAKPSLRLHVTSAGHRRYRRRRLYRLYVLPVQFSLNPIGAINPPSPTPSIIRIIKLCVCYTDLACTPNTDRTRPASRTSSCAAAHAKTHSYICVHTQRKRRICHLACPGFDLALQPSGHGDAVGLGGFRSNVPGLPM